MEYQQKILLLVTGVLVVFALYTAVAAPKAGGASAAEALLMKAMAFGSDAGDYAYAYTESSDGYATGYRLTRKGNDSRIEVQNPLSSKRAFFLQNDSILCISYPTGAPEVCSSVQGESDVEPYMRSLKANFITQAMVSTHSEDMRYLIGRGYVKLDPTITPRTVNGRACGGISYVLDMNGLTLEEAARFGISTDSPKTFGFSMCVDNASGVVYEKSLNYSLQGIQHVNTYSTRSYEPDGAGAITPPANVSEGAVRLLSSEREQQNKLATCFTDKRGDEREKCVAAVALDMKRKDLCELAGARRDRCLVSLVPLTRDAGICGLVTDSSYKDDCYTELAGAFKNSTWCAAIQNQSKVEFCNSVAVPKPAGNGSTSGVDINKLLNYIDKSDGGNRTGGADGANGTGNGTAMNPKPENSTED